MGMRIFLAFVAAMSSGMYKMSEDLFQLELAGRELSQNASFWTIWTPVLLGMAVLSAVAAVMPYDK